MTQAAIQKPPTLAELLAQSSALHNHLCPRQVLGARSAVLAGRLLGLDFPSTDKRVLALVETDGCYADGVSVASGCWLGRRTMRLIDHGKIAATFIDVRTEQAFRIIPRTNLRQRVKAGRAEGQKRWHAYMEAYQTMPEEDLLDAREVEVTLDWRGLLSQPGKRAVCAECGEEIVNEREVQREGRALCISCAGESYWRACLGDVGD